MGARLGYKASVLPTITTYLLAHCQEFLQSNLLCATLFLVLLFTAQTYSQRRPLQYFIYSLGYICIFVKVHSDILCAIYINVILQITHCYCFPFNTVLFSKSSMLPYLHLIHFLWQLGSILWYTSNIYLCISPMMASYLSIKQNYLETQKVSKYVHSLYELYQQILLSTTILQMRKSRSI